MSELINGQAACRPVATGSLPQPEELQVEQLSMVAGGINPQPLPPCHKED